MKDKINTYFAILIITIFGVGASSIIIHVADTHARVISQTGSALNNLPL